MEKSHFDFSTVPTVLGKLSAKDAPSFPHFPQLRRLGLILKNKKGTSHFLWKWAESLNNLMQAIHHIPR
jgi:hypothetical protein